MRKSFFEGESSPEELLARSESTDPFLRWSAAVELGQLDEQWAIQALWRLKADSDENTRTAANNGLKQHQPSEIAAAVEGLSEASLTPDGDYREWKIRPLPNLSDETESIFINAVLDILATEGPTVAARLFRLLGNSVDPNNRHSLSKPRLKKVLNLLLARHAILRNDYSPGSDELEVATYHLANLPSVIVRPRGFRLLAEIPVTEVRAVLKSDRRASRRASDADAQFRAIANQYEIADNEFFVVGGLLEREWFGLFVSDSTVG